MSRVYVRGLGAVSPAGWSAPALMKALDESADLATQEISGPNVKFRGRTVPAPSPRPPCLMHPRLRRASPISQYATAAGVEALGNLRKTNQRLGIVIGVHTASIRYSDRFFGEVLRDPATASPLVFPETVVNAPASHLAAGLGCTDISYSVLGDQTAFVQALLVGAAWLANDRADIVLVIGAEETDWLVSTTANYFSREVICSEGAGALCLMREPGEGQGIELEEISHPQLYANGRGRAAAAKKLAADAAQRPDELLCDSRTGAKRWDAPENLAWRNWAGPTLSPRRILGEGLSAATAWQFVAAASRLREGRCRSAFISAIGLNEQAIASRLKLVERDNQGRIA